MAEAGKRTVDKMTQLNKRTWWHILVWLSFFAFVFSITSYFLSLEKALIIALKETVYLLFIYLLTYFTIFPKFYKNIRQYLIISLLVTIVTAISYVILDNFLVDVFKHDTREGPPHIFLFLKFFMSNSFMFFVATSIRLMEHTSRLRENEKLLTEEKLQTELKLLKAQINPHFIFNALNNIYSLTYMQSKNAPDSVLKLSEMLRYVFYDCSKDRVNLDSEIGYIENFNAFQQMKSDHIQNISITKGKGLNNTQIAPMLFVPFVENAFKYSRIEEEETAYVKIEINKVDDVVIFNVENSVPAENKPMSGSGTGIKNVQNRLDIIYPGQHELKIKEEDGKYVVNLRIGEL